MKIFFNIGYNLQTAIFMELSNGEADGYTKHISHRHLTKIANFNKPFKRKEGFPSKKLKECYEYYKRLRKL